jgi:hypothetical protein
MKLLLMSVVLTLLLSVALAGSVGEAIPGSRSFPTFTSTTCS